MPSLDSMGALQQRPQRDAGWVPQQGRQIRRRLAGHANASPAQQPSHHAAALGAATAATGTLAWSTTARHRHVSRCQPPPRTCGAWRTGLPGDPASPRAHRHRTSRPRSSAVQQQQAGVCVEQGGSGWAVLGYHKQRDLDGSVLFRNRLRTQPHYSQSGKETGGAKQQAEAARGRRTWRMRRNRSRMRLAENWEKASAQSPPCRHTTSRQRQEGALSRAC